MHCARRDVEHDAEELEQLHQRHQQVGQQHYDPQELQVDVDAIAAAVYPRGRPSRRAVVKAFLSAERNRSSS